MRCKFFSIIASLFFVFQCHAAYIPEYEGIEQLIFLSNTHLIVVTNNVAEVLSKIDELSDNEFSQNINVWETGLKEGRKEWGAWHRWRKLYAKHLADARLQVGELELDSPEYYSVNGEAPKRVTRFIASLGGPKLPGEGAVRFAHYSYLELSSPLESGKDYQISLKNGKKVKFHYDEKEIISRAIKVNQVGYLTDAKKKYAYLGGYLQEFGPLDCSEYHKFFVVSNESGETVLEGEIELGVQNQPFTGEDTYQLDLSELKDEGEFYIYIPGVGRSWTFHHGKDVYGEAFYIAARGLYHQRCGIEIEEPYTKWPRVECHTDPVYESESIPFVPNMERPKEYRRFDVIGATLDKTQPTDDATGGWHDASDWDKNISHYVNVFDLLYAFEISPDKFTDAQLNIPESGNGIPDILSEAEYGLRVWKKSMQENGGVAGFLETFTHPSIDDPNALYAYSLRTRWASYIYAAAAAQFAHLVTPFHPEMAKEYAESAKKAYKFALNDGNTLGDITIHAAKDRGKGEPYTINWTEKEEYNTPYYIQASLRLFILTKDKKYLEKINAMLPGSQPPMKWRFSTRDFSPWVYYSLFDEEVMENLPRTLVEHWRHKYLSFADTLLSHQRDQPYQQSWPKKQNYWMSWGASTMTNQARILWIAYLLSGKEKYRNGAILNVDYMLGCNPMGISWTTGLGSVYPIEIQHAVSANDGIDDPVPGITIYGGNSGYFYALKKEIWERPNSEGELIEFMSNENRKIPALRRWSCHPTRNTAQCEFTIHETMSSTIFMTAMLLSENWKPTKKLKNRNPRQKNSLFGYWYLP